ncbi:hypothetical protein AB0L70_06325 [Kribbella sp. NPDC051952]|uniref:hypothetical protein n=1 Tax=Kribbella sp. NPDC051952 TaxID=3154851 RepID=UPI003422D921
MGTQEEEAKALAELERVRTENAIKEMQRQEELRKLQEQQNQNKMVADDPSVASWPADGVQETPGRLDGVKAALGIGAPGDAALAAKLLNSAHAPAGSTVPEHSGDGAKEQTGGVTGGRTTSAALGY